MESAVEWKDNSIGDEINMGYQDDLPIDLCEELEALDQKRVIVQSECIQQVKLEIDEEEKYMQ
jgi:hypothetical protein